MTIHYYQTQEDQEQRWQVIDEAAPDFLHYIGQAYHAGIYSLSESPDTTKPNQVIKYKGNLVFDIDNKFPDKSPNVEQSITDGINLLNVLVGLGVDENQLELYASGGKGFHVIVPGRLFGGHRATENLPKYHSYMASVISGWAKMEGTDLSVFNLGRGKLLRTANKPRANGHFKVPVTAALKIIKFIFLYFFLISNDIFLTSSIIEKSQKN